MAAFKDLVRTRLTKEAAAIKRGSSFYATRFNGIAQPSRMMAVGDWRCYDVPPSKDTTKIVDRESALKSSRVTRV